MLCLIFFPIYQINIAPNMQLIILITIFVPILFSLMYWSMQRRNSNNRMNTYRNRTNQHIQPHKIIIAIDLTDIFVSICDSPTIGFIQLQLERHGVMKYLYQIRKWLGFGTVYYKVKDKSHNIDFIQSLLDTHKVQLYLYTQQKEQITNALLKKLGLCKYFKKHHRRYWDPSSKDKKHPTQIDSETRRVIILTGSKKDYADEDSKYFLIIKRKELRKYGRGLSELIRNNQDIDEFHGQFVVWKMDQFGYDSSHQ